MTRAGDRDPLSGQHEPGRGAPRDAGDAWSGAAPGPPLAPFRLDRIDEDTEAAQERARAGHGPRGQWPLAIVLVGLTASLLIVADDHFRRGSVLFAGFVVLAFVLRLVLTDRGAGWLAVRSRPVDLLCLGLLGGSLSVLALVVPPPS